MLSEPILSNGETNIFVSRFHDSRTGQIYQITIYSNQVSSKTDNLMIIPVPLIPLQISVPQPVPIPMSSTKQRPNNNTNNNTNKNTNNGNGNIQYIDMSSNPNFFKSLDKIIDSPSKSMIGRPQRATKVGNYVACFVENMNELKTLDPRFFKKKINNNIIELIEKYYANSFGFIVCKLQKGFTEYHPFAWIHKSPETTYGLFIPTRMLHIKESESSQGSVGLIRPQVPNNPEDPESESDIDPEEFEIEKEWNHKIYTIDLFNFQIGKKSIYKYSNEDYSAVINTVDYARDPTRDSFIFQGVPEPFVNQRFLITKLIIKGFFDNDDITVF
jgi:hypothetical protein